MSDENTGATTETAAPEPDGNEQAQAPGAESPPAVVDADENPNRKEKDSFSERIDELTRLRREAERDRDYYRDLALQAQKREEPAPREVEREQEVEPELKTLADFGYDERAYGKYMLAEATRVARSEAEKLRSELRESRTAADRTNARQQFSERAEKWAKAEKIEDFDVVFRDPRDGGPSITQEMADTIMDSEQGAALLYHLAKNRDIAAQIARLPPLQQARELGRLEAKLAKPVTQKVSEAPPPPPRVDGSGAAAVSVKADDPASDKLSDAEWTAMRNKQEAARRARRFART